MCKTSKEKTLHPNDSADREYIDIGEVVGAHGLRGELKFNLFVKDNSIISKNMDILLDKQPVSIVSFRPHKSNLLVTLDGVASRNDADEFLKRTIYIPVSDYDTHFEKNPLATVLTWIDREVVHVNGEIIGTIDDVMFTGSNDVLVVYDKDRNETLIPVIDDVIKHVGETVITVSPLEMI